MVNVTVSRILNELDNEYFTLYAEWFDSEIKIMLLKPDATPLSGEMNAEAVSYFSRELSKSSDDYLRKTKEAFCGNDNDVKFSIQDTTFEWKQKNIWILGKIALSRVTDIQTISKTFGRSLNCHRTICEKLITLEKENESFRELTTKLTVQIEEMKKIKDTIESDLYKKFLLILNEKKEKIRELERTIKERDSVADSVFDACTDQSEESEEERNTSNVNGTRSNGIEKRKSANKNNSESMRKTRKTEYNITTGAERNEQKSPKASTSKNFLIESKNTVENNSVLDTDNAHDQKCKVNCKPKKAKTLINFLEEELEEELFSQ